MAQHSDGKNNYALAPWLIIVAILAVLALVIGGFFLFRGNDPASSETVAEKSSTALTPEETSGNATTAVSPTAKAAPSSSVSSTSTEASEDASSSTVTAPSSENKPEGAADEVAPNTLFLLDTSENLTPYFDPVSQGVAEAARAAGAQGSQVGLWNYSSPISATATVGYRQNVAYGDADNVAYAAQMFGTGGVPQTRSAVIAALGNATDQVSESGKDTRVVLITTGTQQDIDDASFAEAVKNARGDGVSLSVVHIGDGDKDAELEKAADSFTAVANPADLTEDKNSFAAAAGAH
ncbi:von Willebrand factor type A domain [Corynebacterium singulare]|uniref:von Willebrand factor type A domain n=2 Tax=Corynebacterium singulare TaxID=161899 RepID=A0A0B6F174_9CORY|nr:von Willebrand factor type A domain [Corynebacterium singulare]